MMDSILCAQDVIEYARFHAEHPLHHHAKQVKVNFVHCAALAEMFDQFSIFTDYFDNPHVSQVRCAPFVLYQSEKYLIRPSTFKPVLNPY